MYLKDAFLMHKLTEHDFTLQKKKIQLMILLYSLAEVLTQDHNVVTVLI